MTVLISMSVTRKGKCRRPLVHTLLAASFLLICGLPAPARTQDSTFITRSGPELVSGTREFYAIGVNASFLQSVAAYADTGAVLEVFRTAEGLGVTSLRSWAFYDGSDTSNAAILQYAPGRYNEHALRALDYVVARARDYSLRLILPLVNNWDDEGGMNQYVRWLADSIPVTMTPIPEKQRIIQGAGGRRYVYRVAGNLTHDDFYTNPMTRAWYRNYCAMLLQRINTFTGIRYSDDPTILCWELANEPRSSDGSGIVVRRWIEEMSSFIKTIDHNHLVSTGEEGFDVSAASYSRGINYPDGSWILDGTAGISFVENLQIPSVDIASIHCYPEAWGISPQAGITWLRDHVRLAALAEKPLLLGEAGVHASSRYFYEALLSEAFDDNTAGVLLWQLAYGGWRYDDGYTFTCPRAPDLCAMIASQALRFARKSAGTVGIPADLTVSPPYPNPFNEATAITYDLPSRSAVRIDVYDGAGRLVLVLAGREESAGHHAMLLDGNGLASGIYYVRLITGGSIRIMRAVHVK